ncbi:MAG: hypothetical protein JST01_22510 [Cyanobacteria bacterium SZAS TMP-1]|nr:hypothetical protein [Cyanobacteria bacterium SZAS TMP-1]
MFPSILPAQLLLVADRMLAAVVVLHQRQVSRHPYCNNPLIVEPAAPLLQALQLRVEPYLVLVVPAQVPAPPEQVKSLWSTLVPAAPAA